ncbi:hypothetical protein P153DRAFT_369933 [Dothidotthia symphoricarpi CBS 119687]|uniref:Uncharacterized protein n=1 Tax=Dothidotthia symphoricarpi CBS 119687 TaxID=1392245 RepID=A0A6A6A468_9PLEO|nr:uncharacterized protein P153DRAFT_369933 [Dothidotthia symphoricarpi CBS 119687]KAF2125943.1 hypothetical protein P153DRAFT_369933 [Dothidotthia symphoricarpi CBS 119687]
MVTASEQNVPDFFNFHHSTSCIASQISWCSVRCLISFVALIFLTCQLYEVHGLRSSSIT